MALFGSPGERIGYRLYPHPGGAPPLFLLHGITASSASFLSNLPALRERFTVVTVDLLGHGDSDAPEPPEPYAAAPAVERILALATQLGFARFFLCGHSLGGALGLRLALTAPERLTGLVVINSNSAAGNPEWRERAAAGRGGMVTRLRAEGPGFLKETSFYPAHSRRLPHEAKAALAADFDRLTGAGVAGTFESLAPGVNAWEELGTLKVPTLVVIGDRDTDFLRNSGPFLARLPAHLVRTVTLEGAGHAANLEAREAFESALFAFAREFGIIA